MQKTITIGGANKDEALIKRILNYKETKGLPSAAEAVRQLCEDALNFKKAAK